MGQVLGNLQSLANNLVTQVATSSAGLRVLAQDPVDLQAGTNSLSHDLSEFRKAFADSFITMPNGYTFFVDELKVLEGLVACGGRDLQAAMDRGFVYVALDKFGFIKELRIVYLNIQNIETLVELNSLRELEITRSSISDFSMFPKLNLESLALRQGGVSDLSFLCQQSSLQELDCSVNSITDIDVLGGLKNLRKINLSYNSVSDVSPLEKLKKLTEVVIDENQVRDIAVFGSFRSLSRLSIRGCEIKDVTQAQQIKKLKELLIGQNQVSDISALKLIPKLRYLDIHDNPITDYSVILDCNSLKRVLVKEGELSSEMKAKLVEAKINLDEVNVVV